MSRRVRLDQKLGSFLFPLGLTWLVFGAFVISGFALVIGISGGYELLVLLAQVEHREVVVVLKVKKNGNLKVVNPGGSM